MRIAQFLSLSNPVLGGLEKRGRGKQWSKSIENSEGVRGKGGGRGSRQALWSDSNGIN